MYKYANPKEVSLASKWCLDVLHDVQKEVKEFFTFDIRLIGSGEKRLVTQNESEMFDLDYNIILQRDKQDLLDNPKQVKKIFMDAFNIVLNPRITDYKFASDSASVITLKLVQSDNLAFSFDVAIIVESNDGAFYRLTNDKRSGRYIWNRVPLSKDYFIKYQQLKENGLFPDFKERYLQLKNMHLRRGDDVKSFSIFLETLNEF